MGAEEHPGQRDRAGSHQDRALWEDPERIERINNANPLRRMGTVEEIAGTALWLASPLSGYVNGQLIIADGGQSLA